MQRSEGVRERVPCPCCSECKGLSDSNLASTERRGEVLMERHASQFAGVVADLLGKCSREEFFKQLPFLKWDGTSRALACPNCGCGPILYSHCTDLTAHHGQERINNACPKCGFLAMDARMLDQAFSSNRETGMRM